MSATPRSQDERTAATRARLLAAATELFGRHGYSAVTVDDIANAAALTKGAVYHHFRDKAAVFGAVFDQCQRLSLIHI